MEESKRCPCNSGFTYGECCGKYHAGAKAPTAEALMRSRFSAFVVGDEDYLMRTWDAASRPPELKLNAPDAPSIRFYRLDILDVKDGGPLDDTGIVEFEAFYKGDAKGSQHERSRFARHDSGWVYVTAE